ncbi:MAG TPA: exopolysaccharide biosynthesis polyprenyl glycosylphosphotransferase [Terracidiphilus sp.]|jgi:exopolysaccharide biosynthesis polyprenyl glycosylphosphotransferase
MSASESTTPRLYAKAISEPRENRLRAIACELFCKFITRVEIVGDLFTCTAGMFVAFALDAALRLSHHAQYPLRQAVAASIIVGITSALFMHLDGAYRSGGSLLQIHATERMLRVPALSLSLLLLLAFGFSLDHGLSLTSILLGLLILPILLILQKLIFSSILRVAHTAGFGIRRAAIYGAGDAGKRIVSALVQSPKLGFVPVAVINDDSAFNGNFVLEMGYRRRHSVPVRSGPITPELLKALQCNVIILALPNLSPESRNSALHAAQQAGVKAVFLSGLELQKQLSTRSIDLDGFSLTATEESSVAWFYTITKRILDFLASIFLLILTAPLLFILALIIKLDSPGPALFVQTRVGRNGELFNIFKFRSMYTNASRYDFSPATSHDLRVTRVGRFIRRMSLDELPQLVNVFLGNMSLVGPRPEMPFIVQEYTPEHRQRLQVIPGITGLWQLSADRACPIHENIEYDLYYLRNRGFFMDMAILIHTLFFAVRRDR